MDCCGYVAVVEDIALGETFGVHFNMCDQVPWCDPCDTSACQTLDVIELILYDVLGPGYDQSMNLKVYGADEFGEPEGMTLVNRDFSPAFSETASFSLLEIDLTNSGQEEGADLTGVCGDFVVLLTWKNSTGHPLLVLDNVSACMDSCPMAPRYTTHTYYYGTEGAWAKQDSIADPEGAASYGWLEALWRTGYCIYSTSTEPTTWGRIKAIMR
jgi:hypothetical protein